MSTKTRDDTHWSGDQLGDMPLRRSTDRTPHGPDNPLLVIASLIVMTFAVFGAIALATSAL